MAKFRDEFADSRLPDLPIAGYATTREKGLTDEVMNFIRQTERDRLQLLDIVCSGKVKLRRVLKKAWRHLKCDDEMADAVFGYLVLLAGENPEIQLEEVKKLDSARKAGLWVGAN